MFMDKELSERSQRIFSEARFRTGLKKETQLRRSWGVGIKRWHLYSLKGQLMFSQFKVRTLSVPGGGQVSLIHGLFISTFIYP